MCDQREISTIIIYQYKYIFSIISLKKKMAGFELHRYRHHLDPIEIHISVLMLRR